MIAIVLVPFLGLNSCWRAQFPEHLYVRLTWAQVLAWADFSIIREAQSKTGVCLSVGGLGWSTAGEAPAPRRRGDLTGADRSFGQNCVLWLLGMPTPQIYSDI